MTSCLINAEQLVPSPAHAGLLCYALIGLLRIPDPTSHRKLGGADQDLIPQCSSTQPRTLNSVSLRRVWSCEGKKARRPKAETFGNVANR